MILFPDAQTLVVFVATAVAILVIPGPAVLYVVARSIDRGWRVGIISALGLSGGAVTHILLATLGVSALIRSSVLAFAGVRLTGASYLVFLGAKTILVGLRTHSASEEPTDSPAWKVFAQAMAINLSNPKAMLFFFAFLPQFVDPARGDVDAQLLGLGAIFLVVALLNDSSWAVLAGSVGAWARRSRTFAIVHRYTSGLLLVGLGIVAAVSVL